MMGVTYPGRDGDAVLFPRCTACGQWRWPSGEICRSCGQPAIAPAVWSGTAHVISEVVVHRGAPEPFLQDGPYRLVKLDLGGFDFITRWATRPARVHRNQAVGLQWGHIDAHAWPLAIRQDEP